MSANLQDLPSLDDLATRATSVRPRAARKPAEVLPKTSIRPRATRKPAEVLPKTSIRPRATPRPKSTASVVPGWSAGNDTDLQDFLSANNYRVSALGQSETHNRKGLDHRHAADVAVSPSSAEGQRLITYLQERGIPHIASDGSESWSTGAHIHLGAESRGTNERFDVGATNNNSSLDLPDLSDLADLSDFAQPAPGVVEASSDDDVIDVPMTREGQEALRLAGAPPRQAPLPPAPAFDPRTLAGRQQRDRMDATAASPNARVMVDVSLPEGKEDWSQVSGSDFVKQTVRQHAAARRIPADFADKFIAERGRDWKVYDLKTGEAREPVDYVGDANVYDSERRTMRVSQEMPILRELEQAHEASKGTLTRAADWATDSTTSAGEKMLDVATPIVETAGNIAAPVDNRLGTLDDAVFTAYNTGSVAEGLRAGKQRLIEGTEPAQSDNPFGEAVREGLSGYPGFAQAGEFLTDLVASPSNLVGGAALKALSKTGAAGRAVEAAGEALTARRLGGSGDVLKLSHVADELGAVAETGAQAARVKPRIKLAADGISGQGIEVDMSDGRFYRDGVAQPYMMSDDGVRRVPLFGADDAPAVRRATPARAEALPADTTTPTLAERPKYQHRDFGIVTESDNQAGLSAKGVRVVDARGKEHVIRRPDGSGRGNNLAVPVRDRDPLKFVNPGQAPVTYGSLNKLVTLERADAARANLRSKLSPTKTNIGGDVTAVNDLATLAAFHVEAGARQFDDFALRMLEDGGEAVKPQLRRLWQQAHDDLGETPPGDATATTQQPSAPTSSVRARKPTVGEYALEVANSFKSLKSSADLSAPHRQGAILATTEPRIAARAYADMFRAFSPAKHRQLVRALELHPSRKLADRSGLYLASRDALRGDVPISQREEAFVGQLVGKIPVVGHVTRFSDRTYSTFLDRLRIDAFDKYRKELRQAGGTKKDLQDIAHFINIATGRGSLSKYAEAVAPVLNAGIFSPRFVKSRFQFLNPRTYAKLSPAARKIAMRKAVGFMVTTGGILTLGKLAGAWDVNLDPASGDFGKARIGNTRFDIFAGEQQSARFLYRMARGTYNNATNAKNEPFQNPSDVASQFLRSKLSPAAGYAWNLADGKDFMGEKFNPASGALELLAPITAGDFVEAYQAEGKSGLLKTLPGLFGVGVSTYTDKSSSGNEDLSKELRRLKLGIGEAKQTRDESPEDFAARERDARQAIEEELPRLIGGDDYKQASDAERKAMVKNVTAQIRREVRE